MTRRLIIGLGIICVLLLGSQLLLPIAISDIMSQGMVSLTGSENVKADVEKRPALLMLGGKFDKITLNAQNAKTDRITFSELNAVLKDVQLDMGTLISRRLVAIQSVGEVDLKVAFSQEELARFLNQSVKGIKNATVAITPDKIQVGSNFSIGGFATVAITLEGKIVGDGQKIKFVTDRILLNNNLVGSIGGNMLTEVPIFDLKKLPFDVKVRNIVLEQGRVVIYTDNRP
ncbi:LmeA family phospholipid-binding protein [Dendrosporobacter sp. 1207_IL3150]|uniref:LmeA family phospholipid-binding protein n=1 Tax=Dendrosporobacter sp. 1207_IL3150 TaxID=3084054 RepID=UPI002FDB336C